MTKDFVIRRWVILEHRVSKNITQGRHFDLLLEEKNSCRTWRMPKVPCIDGPSVKVTPIQPHKLYWLERKEAYISGGRGWAKRVEAGFYDDVLLKVDYFQTSVQIPTKSFKGILEINQDACRIFSI